MRKNERNFWIAAVGKAIVFVLMTVFIILLTLEIQNNGFNTHTQTVWTEVIILVIITIIYICLETRINFLVSNDDNND